jgi:hypothetical protein
METENLREAYIAAFQMEGLPRRMAEDCAQILINDRERDRTPQEQKTMWVAWQIAQGLDEGDIAA